MPAEGMPLLAVGGSQWERHAALLVERANNQDSAKRRRNFLIMFGGAIGIVGGGYTAYRGIVSDSGLGGIAFGLGIVAAAIGGTALLISSFAHCGWTPMVDRDIYQLVQDRQKMRTFSHTLATGDIQDVARELSRYLDITEADLTEFNIVTPASAPGLFLLVDLFRRTVRSSSSLKDQVLTSVKNIWQGLRAIIATEVPYREATV